MNGWEIIAVTIIVIYTASLLFIFAYSLVQLDLVISYIRHKDEPEDWITASPLIPDAEPAVTIQLPIYNELYVAERLLECISQQDYPKAKLEIQVLDDSTDETAELIRIKTAALKERGFNIKHITRGNREGYKAGALAHGLKLAGGNFIAIFDSDFLPGKDFLKRTIPCFRDKNIGMVQTKWAHINKGYSILTELQAFGLDAHFSIEQKGRDRSNRFINFNGTAGIWRRECIEDGGGWQSDTLTEDLDLSYRAQMKGWKFIYLEEVQTPAELPVTMSALKNQQYRWNKGAAECVKKNLGKVLREKNLGLGTKIHAVFHLMNSTLFIAILLTGLLSIPLLFIKENFVEYRWVFWLSSFFLAAFFVLAIFYFAALVYQCKDLLTSLKSFIRTFPLFLSVSMGLSLHNSVAVLEGYFGRKTAFIRTPKFNILTIHENWKDNKYLENDVNWITLAEGILAFYFASGILIAFHLRDFGLLPFHIMLAFGFSFVFAKSIIHSKQTSSGLSVSSNVQASLKS